MLNKEQSLIFVNIVKHELCFPLYTEYLYFSLKVSF